MIRALELHNPLIQFLRMALIPRGRGAAGCGGGRGELKYVSCDYRYLPGREDCF